MYISAVLIIYYGEEATNRERERVGREVGEVECEYFELPVYDIDQFVSISENKMSNDGHDPIDGGEDGGNAGGEDKGVSVSEKKWWSSISDKPMPEFVKLAAKALAARRLAASVKFQQRSITSSDDERRFVAGQALRLMEVRDGMEDAIRTVFMKESLAGVEVQQMAASLVEAVATQSETLKLLYRYLEGARASTCAAYADSSFSTDMSAAELKRFRECEKQQQDAFNEKRRRFSAEGTFRSGGNYSGGAGRYVTTVRAPVAALKAGGSRGASSSAVGGNCLLCEKPGHYVKDCPNLAEQKAALAARGGAR